jgi:hypothetical protein
MVMAFLFEENQLEFDSEAPEEPAPTLLRLGHVRMGMDGHHAVLFNSTATSDITAAFYYEPMPHHNFDYDNDGIMDDYDNCPWVYNNMQEDSDDNGWGDACEVEGLLDSDGDGITDDMDDDIDGDGWLNEQDAEPHNPHVGYPNLNDSDGDGVPDDEDAFKYDPNEWHDTDGDGIGDNSDWFPEDDMRWNEMHLDLDGDGLMDGEDNCPLIANQDQADADDDGLGDACDVEGLPELSGIWHIDGESIYSSVSDELVCDDHGMTEVLGGFIYLDMFGNQMYFKWMSTEEGGMQDRLVGYAVMEEDFSYTFMEFQLPHETEGEIQTFMEGMYSSEFDVLTQSSMQDDPDAPNCVIDTSVELSRLDDAVIEQTVFEEGITWFSSHGYDSTGMPEYEYATVMDVAEGADETFYKYDVMEAMWQMVVDDAEGEYVITDTGVEMLTHELTIVSYGTDGHTASMSSGEEMFDVDLMAADVSGKPMREYLPWQFGEMFEDVSVFADGSIAYLASINQTGSSYRFWCDYDHDDWFMENLNCDNAIVLDWPSDSTDPVLATSIDDLVNDISGSEQTVSIGLDHQYYIEIWSDDGTILGDNLVVNVYRHEDMGNSEALPVSMATLVYWQQGPLELYMIETGEDIMLDYSGMPFFFVESDLESIGEEAVPIVRRGHYSEGGMTDTMLLFNNVAKESVLTEFDTAMTSEP